MATQSYVTFKVNGINMFYQTGIKDTPSASVDLNANIYGVWNADTLGTSLDTSIYRVYNGDNVNDTSGNAQNGTNVGSVTFTTGKVGNAFTFNGSNYVKLPNSSLNSLTGDFSVSFWVYGQGSGIVQALFSNNGYNGTIGKGILIYQLSTYQIVLSIGGGGGTTTLQTTSITNATWHHIVVTRLGSTRSRIYLNGSLIASNTDTRNPEYFTNTTPCIGAVDYNPNNATTGYFCANGTKLDAVNVWNREITSTEIRTLYAVGNGVEYPYTNQYITSIDDSTTNNNHGSQTDTTALPTFTTGKIGKSFVFDGINDHIILPNNSLNINGNFSVSAWVKYTPGSGIKAILSNNALLTSPTRQYGYGLYLNGTSILYQTYDGTSTVGAMSYNATMTTGNWYHITITKSSTTKKIYFNGSEVASGSVNSITYTGTHRPTIGAQRYDATGIEYYSVSQLDAISVWNKELSSTEVASLYNSGTGKQYPFA